ncbi:MAG: hypothetical protein ABSB69_04330 [Solirubrobacteraceae bacterium]
MTDAPLKIALGTGLVIGVAALGITLSQSPITVAEVSTAEHGLLGTTTQKLSACQSNEVLPRETSAIRLRVETFIGPKVAVEVLAHGRVIAHGERESGWTGGVVTIPVEPLSMARSGVELCFTLFLNGDESAELVGERTTGALAAQSRFGPLAGRVRVEYLRPGRSSWWSLAPAVARRMGLGRAWSGTWNVLLVFGLMGGMVLLCSRMMLREWG